MKKEFPPKLDQQIFFDCAILMSAAQEANEKDNNIISDAVFRSNCCLIALKQICKSVYLTYYYRSFFAFYFRPKKVKSTETWFKTYEERILALLLAKEIIEND